MVCFLEPVARTANELMFRVKWNHEQRGNRREGRTPSASHLMPVASIHPNYQDSLNLVFHHHYSRLASVQSPVGLETGDESHQEPRQTAKIKDYTTLGVFSLANCQFLTLSNKRNPWRRWCYLFPTPLVSFCFRSTARGCSVRLPFNEKRKLGRTYQPLQNLRTMIPGIFQHSPRHVVHRHIVL